MRFISKILNDDLKIQIIDQIFAYKAFGLRYDRDSTRWFLVLEDDMDVVNTFNIGKQGDKSKQKLDASWILKFTTNKELYTVEYRQARYLFESDKEIKFYFDSSDKVYNNMTGKIVRDKVTVLSNNNKFNQTENFSLDYEWAISEEYRDSTGYINSKKIELTFFDSDDDGVVDNPNIFNDIVPEYDYPHDTWIFQKRYMSPSGVESYDYISNDILKIKTFQNKLALGPLSSYDDGQIFYYIDENRFEIYNKERRKAFITPDYKAFIGRDKLKFHYEHAADDSMRIDPSVSNIIDTYVLTKTYDRYYRQWLISELPNEPLPLSSDQL